MFEDYAKDIDQQSKLDLQLGDMDLEAITQLLTARALRSVTVQLGLRHPVYDDIIRNYQDPISQKYNIYNRAVCVLA